MKEILTNKNILTERSDILNSFFRDIAKYPIYSSGEQIELARKMKAGDDEARDKLIKSNLRFVVTCAKQYVNQGVPLLDLIQCGSEGLIQSLDKYDPDKGYNVISFAVWYIRREIIKAIYNTGRTIRYPITYISRITKVKKAYDKFVADNNREPTDEELLKLTNLTQRQYNSVIFNKSYCQSLETPLTEEYTLQDTIPDNEDPLEEKFTKESIRKCLRFLNERERKVIIEYYGIDCEPLSIKEIAAKMDLGDERVRQLRKGGIKKLREKCGNILKTLL